MANRGKQPVETLAGDDVQVQVTDGTTPSQKLKVNSDGTIEVRLRDGDGSAIGNVSDALKVDLASQGLAGVKLSRDGGAPTTSNPNYVELVADGSAVGTANPLPVTTGGIPGTIKRGEDDGAYKKDANVAANGGTANHDTAVASGVTLTVYELTVSSLGAATFDVINNQGEGASQTIIDTLVIGSEGGTVTKSYRESPIVCAGGGDGNIFRILKTNHERGQTLDLYSSYLATLD